jgi:hypothetical protein
MRLVGIVLIALGALALVYQGFSYVTRDVIVDAGPVHITADREHTVWLPPVVGLCGFALGIILLIWGDRRKESM